MIILIFNDRLIVVKKEVEIQSILTEYWLLTSERFQGYNYAGSQYANECYCGNEYGKHGPADNCDSPCPGDSSEMCGGGYALSVMQVRNLENGKSIHKLAICVGILFCNIFYVYIYVI